MANTLLTPAQIATIQQFLDAYQEQQKIFQNSAYPQIVREEATTTGWRCLYEAITELETDASWAVESVS